MAKFLAVTIIVIALLSALPVLMHTWEAPPDISTHGHLIDEQMSETMVEAGKSFLAAQLLLALFIWRFSGDPPNAKVKTFSRGGKGFVVSALRLGGRAVMALRGFGVEA